MPIVLRSYSTIGLKVINVRDGEAFVIKNAAGDAVFSFDDDATALTLENGLILNTTGIVNLNGANTNIGLLGGQLQIESATFNLLSPAITFGGEGAMAVDVPLTLQQQWSDVGTTFHGIQIKITDTNSAAGSVAFEVFGGAAGTTSLFKVDKAGVATAAGVQIATATNNIALAKASLALGGATIGSHALAVTGTGFFSGTLTLGDGSGATAILASNLSGATDPTITFSNGLTTITNALTVGSTLTVSGGSGLQCAANVASTTSAVIANTYFQQGGQSPGNAATGYKIVKKVTAFTNAVAKTVFTITVPNAAHSASVKVRLCGSLGAGGTVGANESSASISYDIVVTKTSGANCNAAISAAYGSTGSTGVASSDTCAITAAVTLASATSVTVDVTITRGGGASDNHTCMAVAELINSNATGVTIA